LLHSGYFVRRPGFFPGIKDPVEIGIQVYISWCRIAEYSIGKGLDRRRFYEVAPFK
jgi:hypothetical protein